MATSALASSLVPPRCATPTSSPTSSSTSLAFSRIRSLSRSTGSLDLTASFFADVNLAVTARREGRSSCRGKVTMMAPIGTPKVPYRTPGEGGWQWVDIWNVLYRERIIFLGQYIDEEFGNQVVATMLYLDSVDNSKPMHLYINCPGGDITPCMAIYDTMESIKSPVGTLALGYAYNNAGLLLAAGAKGMRVAMPLTRVALMSPAGAARGQVCHLCFQHDTYQMSLLIES
uniref:ATP-dependent Clp protease proteolytic subunit n=1 Tax=Physcomitrium patens TaxID=3218 RepID=A0A7I4D777_PHYPA